MNDLGVPDEVVCGAIQTCYGYKSGTYLTVYRHGAGRIVVNSLNISENLMHDPVAEHLLRNLLNYASSPEVPRLKSSP